MAHDVMSMHRLSKVLPSKKEILKDISLSFFDGAKIGVLGLNGSGKSSLLRIMAGVDRDYTGSFTLRSDIQVGYLPQEPQLQPSDTVRMAVESGVAHIVQLLKEFQSINESFAQVDSDEALADLLAKQSEVQSAIDEVDGWNLEVMLQEIATSLRMPPWDAVVGHLSGGEKRRVALGRLLISNPNLLLLDEPTNHLDAESVAWLEKFLKRYKGTVVAVTHDRYFLDHVAEWILELDRGHGIPYKGHYSDWLEQKEKRLASEAKQEEARQKVIRQELEWVRSGKRTNHARIQNLESLMNQEYQTRAATQSLYIPPGPRLGDQVLQANRLCYRMDNRVLIEDLSFILPPGGVMGIIGPNGAGKTTLLKLIAGTLTPTSGHLSVGSTVRLAYIDQDRSTLRDHLTVWEEVSDGLDIIAVGSFTIPSRAYLGRFNFKGQDQQKLVQHLSGGERHRIHLAKLLKTGANTLLLDEPSNDLDVETLQALECAMESFPGSMVVISHDRWFLDRIATHILAFEGHGKTLFFEGNYSEYERYIQKRRP